MRALAFVACVVVMARPASGSPADSEVVSDVDAIAADAASLMFDARAPSIADVLSAAYGAAGLDRNPARSWIRRARLAGLIPWVTVRMGRDTSWQDTELAVGHGTAMEVRATWRLDRLVFDGRELQVASIESARRRERRRLASRVIRAYFTWRRAAERQVLPGEASRAEEAAAELDALTDGWFSDELATPRRTASGTRTD